MPRQAVYSLASRSGDFEKKEEIVKNYSGEPKEALLDLIRKTFPLSEKDERAQNAPDFAIRSLRKLCNQIKNAKFHPTPKQKATLHQLLEELHSLL
jgi:hypothetical protein